ncbi:MAG: IS110 family transposase [Planctomycetes bacterium]|nr:IS110 family transposase [Planctomycetota bacterium]
MRMLQVAMLLPGSDVPIEWQVANEGGAIRRMVKKIQREAKGEVRMCYEAGPCGYALQRTLKDLGVDCMVIAPSLIPMKPGDRIKTDKRDARKLAGLFRAELLTEVHPPTPGEESVRDLSRCREDAKADLMRARHRLSKMLLRRGIVWEGGKKNWSQAYMKWLRTLSFDHPADKLVFGDYLLAIEHLEERLQGLDSALESASQKDPYRGPVAALRCFQGIDTVTAITVVAELHDFRRFQSARELMAFLGLVPSEHSSSDSRKLGSITKTGNGHARRVLIESAWHYRHPPRLGPALRKRREGQAAAVIAVADKAAQRLHRKFGKLQARGKPMPKVVVAVARELVGFLWAVLYPASAQAS